MKKKIIMLFLSIATVSMIGCQNNKNLHSDKENTNISSNENVNSSEDLNIDKNDTQNNKVTTKSCRLYYFNVNNESLYHTDVDVEIEDGAIVKALIENLKKLPENTLDESISSSITTIPNDIEVISAKVDEKANLLTVDFSKNFAIGKGSLEENAIIESITNTLGHNLGVNNIKITFKGEPYSSGHFAFTEDEYFTIKNKRSVEF